MNIQIFGTKKCFDTKKAERYFKERNIKYQLIDLKEKGMSKGEYTSVKQAVGGQQTLPGRRHVSTPGAGPFRREPPAGHADPYESTGSLYSRVLMG